MQRRRVTVPSCRVACTYLGVNEEVRRTISAHCVGREQFSHRYGLAQWVEDCFALLHTLQRRAHKTPHGPARITAPSQASVLRQRRAVVVSNSGVLLLPREDTTACALTGIRVTLRIS